MQRRAFLIGTAAFAGAGCTTPEPFRSDDRLDASGDITVRIDGESLDLSADRFQSEHADSDSVGFHLHEDDDNWYMEGEERVTVAEGLHLLPNFAYHSEAGYRSLHVDGTRYDESTAGTELAVFVNGRVVDPSAYHLRDGDELLVIVTTQGRQKLPVEGDGLSAAGEIAIHIDGERFDLSADRFQSEHADESRAFHLHEGDGKWYMEGDERVTVGEGLDLLPAFSYDREEGFHALAIDDTTYDQREAGTAFAFFVNGSIVDPTAWQLADGDAIRVELTTGG